MPETDANGHSKVSGLEQGLYLVVETRVPENVISTCNPFFVSLPMTTIDGKDWNYDVTVYPKNQTGNPTLEKTVREDKNSTGKNGGTADIADILAHIAHYLDIGLENNVCMGCDFDGVSSLPAGITGIRDIEKLGAAVEKEFSSDIADKIFFRNAESFLRRFL